MLPASMTKIRRRYDKKNLVRELAQNKVDALELLREALANAKDHFANHAWIKTTRATGGSNAPDVLLMNDGEGMGSEELSAFWGVSSSVKPAQSIGYKGHGTKLYFASHRLHVATRRVGEAGWRWSVLERPDQADGDEVEEQPLPPDHRIARELEAAGLEVSGVAILIEGCTFSDAPVRLLSRRSVESYCDWFTVIGDVRSGLFRERREFHDVVDTRSDRYEALRVNEVPLRPIELMLSINGETQYRAAGLGPAPRDKELLAAWGDDVKAHLSKPGLLAFGHRFADHHESQSAGAKRVRDDLSSLCLVPPESFGDDPEYAVVLRVEGHRRQRETYREATWSGKSGEYKFDERFGLWLCKDFVPVVQQNEWLREAIDRASQKKNRLGRYELKTLRNWQVFVNSQSLLLTANRNDISNLRDIREKIVTLLAKRIEIAFDEDAFADWVTSLQSAVARGQRDKEVRQMEARVDKINQWFRSAEGVEPATITSLEPLEEDESLRLPEPRSEQELFHLYAVLSGSYRVPLRVLEYNAREGIDAVTQVRDARLFNRQVPTARVEFKYIVWANRAIGHYFDAIDAVICWRVELIGTIREGSDVPIEGTLRKRQAVLDSGLDSHEIEYTTSKGETRILPVLTIQTLFAKPRPKRKRS